MPFDYGVPIFAAELRIVIPLLDKLLNLSQAAATFGSRHCGFLSSATLRAEYKGVTAPTTI